MAVVIGCLLYLQWALLEGLYTFGDLFSYECRMVLASDGYLPGDFWGHFLAVSLLVYGVMAVVTCLGVWLPARNISRVPPVEALREE